MIQFHETVMGRNFIERTVPSLISSVKDAGKLLSEQNRLLEKQNELLAKQNELLERNIRKAED